MNTISAILKRRSTKSFNQDYVISQKEIEKLIKLAMCAPSAFNLQHWRFLILDKKEIRESVQKLLLNQKSVTSASRFIILCADLDAWKTHPEHVWRYAPENVISHVKNTLQEYYSKNPLYIRDDAVKSCALAAQNLLLAATSLDYDSTLLSDYNHAKLSQIIELPQNYIITMCIAIGKKTRIAAPKTGDMDFDEVVYYNTF